MATQRKLRDELNLANTTANVRSITPNIEAARKKKNKSKKKF